MAADHHHGPTDGRADRGLRNRLLIAFGITVVAALAAWSARETYRVRMEDLGEAGAQPVAAAEYDRLRNQALAQSGR